MASKTTRKRRSRKGKEKAVLRDDGAEDSGSDYTSGEESESEDEDHDVQVGNDEVGHRLPLIRVV